MQIFEHPYNFALRTPEPSLTVEAILEHFKFNTNAFLPFFNACPNCKSINTGAVGCEALKLGEYEQSICCDCDTGFSGVGKNYLQQEYMNWLIELNMTEEQS